MAAPVRSMRGGGVDIRAAFQGEAGAYSEGAAVSFFGPAARVTAVPHQTFAGAADSAASGSADCAVIPVENSIEGSVGESSDLLRETSLRAFGEAYHRIEHCLIGHGGVGDVRTVYSHPQALGQCRRFIKERGWRAVPAYDTAGSAMMVARMGPSRADAACIASRHAAGVHGVPVIRGDIADRPDNHTRFLVLGRAAPGEGEGEGGSRPRPDGPLAAALEAVQARRDGAAAGAGAAAPMKTSVIFSVRHEPGALAAIVGALGARGINMAKIESRADKERRLGVRLPRRYRGRRVRRPGGRGARGDTRARALPKGRRLVPRGRARRGRRRPDAFPRSRAACAR